MKSEHDEPALRDCPVVVGKHSIVIEEHAIILYRLEKHIRLLELRVTNLEKTIE